MLPLSTWFTCAVFWTGKRDLNITFIEREEKEWGKNKIFRLEN